MIMAKAKEARESNQEAVPTVGDGLKGQTSVSFAEEKPSRRHQEEQSLRIDPIEAASRLVAQLTDHADRTDVLVLTLRRGVQVALAVASALRAPFDLILVRKLCVPWDDDLAMGALATGGVRVLYEDVINDLQIPEEVIDSVTERELRKLNRRERAYRGGRPAPDVSDHSVILVNDGLTNGSMTRAAAMALRRQQPKEIIVAVPFADTRTCDEFREEVDRIVSATTMESSSVSEKLGGPARRTLQFMRALRRFRKGSR